MPYCQRCGKEVNQYSKFCSNCGADLKFSAQPTKEIRTQKAEKDEKQEKHEKSEKSEKEEKHEKEETSSSSRIVIGLALIFLGVIIYLANAQVISFQAMWPYFLVFLGIIILIIAVYAIMTASKRNPRP